MFLKMFVELGVTMTDDFCGNEMSKTGVLFSEEELVNIFLDSIFEGLPQSQAEKFSRCLLTKALLDPRHLEAMKNWNVISKR